MLVIKVLELPRKRGTNPRPLGHEVMQRLVSVWVSVPVDSLAPGGFTHTLKRAPRGECSLAVTAQASEFQLDMLRQHLSEDQFHFRLGLKSTLCFVAVACGPLSRAKDRESAAVLCSPGYGLQRGALCQARPQPPRVMCVRTAQGTGGRCFVSAPGSGVMGMEVICGKALETMTQFSVLSPCPPL